MDSFTFGALGLSFVLSHLLNRKETEKFQTNDRTSANITDLETPTMAPDPKVVESRLVDAISNRNIADIKKYERLLTNNPELKQQAAVFIEEWKKYSEPEKLNNYNFNKQKLSTTSDDKTISEFAHNNFVPFLKGRPTQNMAGTNVPTGNYIATTSGLAPNSAEERTPYSTRLAHFTGRDPSKPLKSKAHQPQNLFKPSETNEANIHGTPLYRPDTDRYINPTGRRHDLIPVEKVNVGKGLNCSPDTPACGGYHDNYRTAPTAITAYPTHRSTAAQAPIKGKSTSHKGYSSYKAVEDIDNLNSTETFGQESEESTFVSKRCNTFVTTENRPLQATKFDVAGESNRSDYSLRRETYRGNANTYVGPGNSDVPAETADRTSSYQSDAHNISSQRFNREQSLPQGNGVRYASGQENPSASYYVNQTDRGQANNTLMGGAMAGTGHASLITDAPKTTLKELSVRDLKGGSYSGNGQIIRNMDDVRKTIKETTSENDRCGVAFFGKGQQSNASYRNHTGKLKITTEAAPQPGRLNLVQDPNKRAGVYNLASKEVDARQPSGAQGNTQSTSSRPQAQFKPQNSQAWRQPMGGTISGYNSKPMDTRIDCK